ncbi:uncharacterized protein LOC117092439 isoform X1 [Trachypithecus francoisi]|uniref:uncharacterized protein LOC117092439 isoform X1 n=1 Tax=Trachypithecus francoisi TaxID=54180 RepID=UPI00141ACFBC|nr:uncharacterized protein LOC117092439 isoform X1 [Trachypithecus francoisi]
MVSGGRDSRRVEQQEETSGGRNVTRIAGRRQRGSQPQSLVDAVLVNLPHIQCPYDLEDRTRNELSPVPTRQPPGQEKVMGSILLTSKMELQVTLTSFLTVRWKPPPHEVKRSLLQSPIVGVGDVTEITRAANSHPEGAQDDPAPSSSAPGSGQGVKPLSPSSRVKVCL